MASQAWASGRVVSGPLAISIPGVPVTVGAPVAIPFNPAQLSLGLPGGPLFSPTSLPAGSAVLAPAALLPAARQGLAAGASGLAQARRAADAEAAALAASALFDGATLRRAPETVQPLLPFPEFKQLADPPASGLPKFLSVANPEHADWIGSVVREAWRSKTGRRILRDAAMLSAGLGRPITVVVADLRANNGEYVYDWDAVRMGHHYLKKDPAEAAPTLVHELLHVVQKSHILPTDAFEMELEAYGVTFEVMRELAVPFAQGSFYRKAYLKFHGPLDAYVKWLLDEYDNNRSVIGSRLSAYIEELEKARDKSKRKLARLDKKIAQALAVVAEMERTGQDPRSIEHYRIDIIGQLALNRRSEAQSLGWAERDLDLLASETGRERYRKYSKRVLEYTRRLHARYNAEPDWKSHLKK